MVESRLKSKKIFDKFRHSSVNQDVSIRQPVINQVSFDNKVGYSSKGIKPITKETNYYSSDKNKIFLKKRDCSVLEKIGETKTKQTFGRTRYPMSENSDSNFVQRYKCTWCSLATVKVVIKKHERKA